MHRLARLNVLLLGTALASTSCSSKDQPAPGPSASCDGGTAPVNGKCGAPSAPCDTGSLLIDGQCVAPTSPWTEIKPGGSTACMHGDPYSYFVHLGTTNKLLIYFAFGGFCYNAQLCAPGAVNFVPKVNVDTNMLSKTSGIVDLNRADNPFKDWSWVYVPECTADFEMGHNVADYPAMGTGPAATINHNGFVNVTAVRDWIYQNFPSPERIFVSGSSGGGDAAIYHYPYLRQHYPTVKNWTLFADSSFGVVPDDFFSKTVVSWNAGENLPKWIPGIVNASPLTWDVSVIEGAKFYKEGITAEFGTSYDLLETFVLGITGGNQSEWHDKMEAHIKNVSSQVPNFRYLIAPGTAHIALNQTEFYEYQVNGTTLRDWVADLASGKDVKSDQCTSNCKIAPTFPPKPDAGTGAPVESQILCLGKDNCNSGEVCCGSPPQSTSCVSGTASSSSSCSFQMCVDDTECSAAGKKCNPLVIQGRTVGVCG